MAALYKPLKDKLWQEAEKNLDITETTRGDSFKYVEGLVGGFADDDKTMVYQRVLMEPPMRAAPTSQPPRGRRPKPLSRNKRKELGLNNITSSSEQKYSLYLSLHDLWYQYMLDLLKPTIRSNTKQLSLKVLKADLHGCIVKVVESRCKGNIGTEGIVLQETQNTFKIITSNDRILTIPKGHTVFQFTLGDHLFTLYGNQLRYRSSERTTRKFKDKFFFNL